MPAPRPLQPPPARGGGSGRARPAATTHQAARAPRPTRTASAAPPRPPPATLSAPIVIEAVPSLAHQHRRFSAAGPRSGHVVVDVAVVGGEGGNNGTQPTPLAHALPALFPARFASITAARRACRRGEVLVNGVPAPVDAPLAPGDEVTCTVRTVGGGGVGGSTGPASLVGHRASPSSSVPPISVAYEDDHLALVVKPPGLPTQGAGRGAPDVQGLLPGVLAPTTAPGALWRPRPVHRPDAWLGGLVLVAKTRPALSALTSALGSREVAWRYAGLVAGKLTGAGRVAAPLDGRPALTEWAALKAARVEGRTGWVTAVQLRAVAGPPAQLRRHMALAGHPLVGDALGGGGGGEGGGGRRGSGSLGGAAAAALFAAKRGARRLADGAAAVAAYHDTDDETRNSASTARARFGRADDRPWAVAVEAQVDPPPAAAAPPVPTAASPDAVVDDDDARSALSGTLAVDRLRADAAADARAAAREAAGGGGGGFASAAVPAPSLGVSGRAAGWASRRAPAPLPRAASGRAAAADAGSPWDEGGGAAGGLATAPAARPDTALRPSPPPPPPAARTAVDRLAVDFDPPPLMVASAAAAAPAVDARLLATPTPPSALDRRTTRHGVPACLWAVHVSLTHPVTGELLTVAIPPPADLALSLPFGRRD